MSDDELEKLAAEMKNIRASDDARQRGMAAAMAAFDAEFAAETETVGEKVSSSSQGLEAQARPTGQTTRNGRAATLGRDAMSKLKEIFTFKPKAMMMMGTCAAALFATSLYIPNTRFEDMPVKPAPQAVMTEVGASEGDEEVSDSRVVTAKKLGAENSIVQEQASKVDVIVPEPSPVPTPMPQAPAPQAPALKPPATDKTVMSAPAAEPVLRAEGKDINSAPAQPQGGLNSVSDFLNKVRTDSAKTEAENRNREAKFRQRRDQKPALLATKQARPTTRIGNATPTTSSQTSQVGGYVLEEVPGSAEVQTVTETVVIQEASTELVTIPATYETVTETVVVTPQSVEYVVEPPEYEWVEGDVEGSSVEYKAIPAEYETVQEPVVVQEASTELVAIPATYETVMETVVLRPEYVAEDGSKVPAVTKQQSRRVVKTPASTQERVVPAVTKMETRRVVKTPASTVERIVPYEKRDGKTRVPVTPAKVVEKVVPAVTKNVSRRVVKTPAMTQERVVPSVPQQVTRQVLVSQPKFYLRDDSGQIIREFESRDQFEKYQASLTTLVTEKPVSTFSIDVDTASYSFLRSSLNRGQIPPRSAIRLEEMINYFPYDYEAPRSADEPFKANVTVTSNPWNADTKLMHVGIKGYVPPAEERQRSNLVFLIDTSGSMNAPNKLPLLINSFKLLLNTLDDDDTVSIVTYAGRAGTVLEPTAASDKHAIKAALDRLRSGGSTAGAAGLELAYNKAMESFDEEGINRVILATDGDFNVGFSSPDDMKSFVEKKRKTGIFLSVLGFGHGNYNDHLMQSLAQNGNGIAAYIDNLAETNKVLADEAGSALVTIAKDVKIQVEFNPETISEYRLIGYETRALKREDFNNDKVDAGEIGAGHSITAIYELTPVGSPARSVDPLRYVKEAVRPKVTGSDEFAFVKIRHKLPNADTSTLQTFPVGPDEEKSLQRAGNDMRFAAAVAAVGQKLRGDTQLEGFSYDEAIELASGAKGEDEHGYRAEFISLVRLMKSLEE